MPRKNTHSKPGVMLYFEDMNAILGHLTMEQRGCFLTAVLHYSQGLPMPEMDDFTKFAFSLLKSKLDRDTLKYQETITRGQYAAYVRECKRKKLAPLLYAEWLENGKGGEEPSKDEKWVDYDSYMQSDEWSKKREERLRLDSYRCRVCGSTSDLDVHHLTYQRFGNEDINDLVTLCRNCHQEQHEASTSTFR